MPYYILVKEPHSGEEKCADEYNNGNYYEKDDHEEDSRHPALDTNKADGDKYEKSNNEERENKNENEEGEDEVISPAEERLPAIMEQLNLDIPWELKESNEPRAYAGKESITITTELADRCSDDTLAWIMSHEYTHIQKEHLKQKQKNVEEQGQALEHYWQDPEKGTLRKVLGSAARIGLYICDDRTKSRQREREAEAEATKIAQESGFNPEAARDLMQQFADSGGLLCTHPSGQERIKNMKKQLNK